MQASDEERIRMLESSISGVSDQFQSLQTDQAKRAFAKQISESSDLDLKVVVGLLEKTQTLSSDLAEISRKPTIEGSFTREGRQAAALRISTTEDLKKVQDEINSFNPIVVKLSEITKENTKFATAFTTTFFEKLDRDVTREVAKGGVEALANAGRNFFEQVTTLPETFKKFMNDYSSKVKPDYDKIVSGNTNVVERLNNTLNNGISVKIDLTGKVDSGGNIQATFNTKTPPALTNSPIIKSVTAMNAALGI
jgi:hypothetical protein